MSAHTSHDEARRLLACGFKLCVLHPMSKQPWGENWNTQLLTHPDQVEPVHGGFGMPLAVNGLCSIDFDNAPVAERGLRVCGFDPDWLRDLGVATSSTRPGSGGRVAFRVPAGARLRWLRFTNAADGTILELRASSANLQDCLPGTVYRSADGSGPWRQDYAGIWTMDTAPDLPPDLLAWWERMSSDLDFLHEQQVLIAGPAARLDVSSGATLAYGSVHRQQFNRENSVEDILLRHGYTGKNGRYAPPTATGGPGIRKIPDKQDLWQSDHASDPLFGTFDAWSAFVALEHDQDLAAAERAAEKTRAAVAVDGFEEVETPSMPATIEKAQQRLQAGLAQLRGYLAGCDDSITLRMEAVPKIASLLAQMPALELDAFALVAARFKELGTPINRTEFKKLVKRERPEPSGEVHPLTEFGNVGRLVDKYKDALMYVPDAGQWYVWTGVYWRKALGNRTEVMHFCKEVIRELPDERDKHQNNAEEFFAFCAMSQRAHMVGAMVSLAESEQVFCVPSAELDKHRHLFGVKNGVVDLRTGELLAPDAEYRITCVAACDYNPDAKAPSFMKALRDAFYDDDEMVEYVLRTFGYAIQGNPKESVMFIAFGTGANGKGTVIDSVRKALGGYARAVSPETFLADGKSAGGNGGGPREDLVRLRGARMLYVNEPDEHGELKEGLVKSMTGGDTITARGVHATTSIEIVPTWTIYMPTNYKPIIKGDDNGIWRRLRLMPFERNFRDDPNIREDKGLKDRIEATELPGILALIVRAGLTYQQFGLESPRKVKEVSDAYRKDQDLLSDWLEECCETGPALRVRVMDLWDSWRTFAERRGISQYIRSSKSLGRRLDSRFPTGKGTNGVRERVGLALKSVQDIF